MQHMDGERSALTHDTTASQTACPETGPDAAALPTDAELRKAAQRARRAERRADETRIAYAALLGRPLAAFIAEHFPEVVSVNFYADFEDRSVTLRDASGAEYKPSPAEADAYDDLYDECWEFETVLLPAGGERTFTLDDLHRGDLSGGWV